MSRPTYLTIDLTSLTHNFDRVRRLTPHSSIMAMVKANAYGHGIVPVARALKQAEAFGVASLEEAIQLRQAGITQPITLMEGVFAAEELVEAAYHQCHLVVHHEAHLDMLQHLSCNHSFFVWLKINTGLHRLGFDIEEVAAAYKRLQHMPQVRQPIGLMTHFAEADILAGSITPEQIKLFAGMTKDHPGPRSLANSAGILGWPASHQDWVRPGLMLYGASPFVDRIGLQYDLQPVMTFSSRLIAVHKIKKGARVGYGGQWCAPEDLSIGIVGVGYGDGYPQYAKEGTPLLVNNVICPLVGRVSMDMLAVDLRPCPQAVLNDPVILWGKGLPVEKVAYSNATSAWELLTRMTPRPKVNII